MSIQTAFSTIRNPFAGRRPTAAELDRLARRQGGRGHGLDGAQSLRAQAGVTLSVR
jgi:hypothetical protein